MTEIPEPPITEDMREQARQQPNTWMYSIDPFFAETAQTGGVPPFGIVGAYHVNAEGSIDPTFTANPNYRPSPVALGMPDPTNEVERALQLAATGYGEETALHDALLAAEVYTPVGPEPDTLLVVDEGEDRHSVLAYTSEHYLPGGVVDDHNARIPVRVLLPLLTGRYLTLNPGSMLTVRIPGEDLTPANG